MRLQRLKLERMGVWLLAATADGVEEGARAHAVGDQKCLIAASRRLHLEAYQILGRSLGLLVVRQSVLCSLKGCPPTVETGKCGLEVACGALRVRGGESRGGALAQRGRGVD